MPVSLASRVLLNPVPYTRGLHLCTRKYLTAPGAPLRPPPPHLTPTPTMARSSSHVCAQARTQPAMLAPTPSSSLNLKSQRSNDDNEPCFHLPRHPLLAPRSPSLANSRTALPWSSPAAPALVCALRAPRPLRWSLPDSRGRRQRAPKTRTGGPNTKKTRREFCISPCSARPSHARGWMPTRKGRGASATRGSGRGSHATQEQGKHPAPRGPTRSPEHPSGAFPFLAGCNNATIRGHRPTPPPPAASRRARAPRVPVHACGGAEWVGHGSHTRTNCHHDPCRLVIDPGPCPALHPLPNPQP